MKYAIIDVDETLYNYATPLYQSCVSAGIKIDTPDKWYCWDYFYPQCMTKEMAQYHFDLVHQRQMDFEPYSDAKRFLTKCCDKYTTIIASHRKPARESELENWLVTHNLPYDVLWVGEDKTGLFDESVEIVVDDSPYTLEAATQKGIRAIGLLKPWNLGRGFELYNTLSDIGDIL